MDGEYVIPLAAAVAVAVYVIARIEISRLLEKLGTDLGLVFAGISSLFAFSIFLSLITLYYNILSLFILVIIIFIFSVIVIVISMRHILEEYFAGTFVANVHGIHIGDYIEVGNISGYIIAMKSTSLVVRDKKKNLVHLPYTQLLHMPLRVVKPEEGHEVSVHIYVPRGIDLGGLRRALEEGAAEAGLEGFKIDVARISARGIVIAARGLLRDPRREEEVKYALLDRAYSLLSGGQHEGQADERP